MDDAQSATSELNRFGKARLRVAGWIGAVLGWADKHWKWLTFVSWVGIAIYLVIVRWEAMRWLALGDTDDNIRYVQVRDWLDGQGWYDLRQHRFDPPIGGNIHWSRLVDLPIAGLMLLFRMVTNPFWADRLALGIAPLLPLLPLMLALAFITRRLVPATTRPSVAWMVAIFGPLAAGMAVGMYFPMRVDHHGWQLALTLVMLAGLVDRDWVRGGIVAAVSSALSIAIGMEMIVYIAAGGAAIALRWVFKEGAARRMRPYAAALGFAMPICFLAFASNDNRQSVCDAISPVWTVMLLLAAGGMLLLAGLPLRNWWQRLAAGVVVGGAVLLTFWLIWPQCLTGAYGTMPPELQAKWLVNIREAKPLYVQPRSFWLPLAALPAVGILGSLVACWRFRRDNDALWAWGTVGAMTLFAFLLLFWQIRTGPAAQLMAIPAAAWLAAAAAEAVLFGNWRARGLGIVGLICAVGVLTAYGWSAKLFHKPPVKRMTAINSANAKCRTQPGLAWLDQLPAATIFTMVDLGPRIIASTHHSALTGPYHRNAATILAIHHAFDGPPEAFRAIAARHRATYLMICPNFPEGTVYSARSPRGFYAQLMHDTVPAWLKPVPLKVPIALPYRIWRIDYSTPGNEKVP